MPNYNHSHPKPEQQDPPAILGFGSGISFLVLSKGKATYHLAGAGGNISRVAGISVAQYSQDAATAARGEDKYDAVPFR